MARLRRFALLWTLVPVLILGGVLAGALAGVRRLPFLHSSRDDLLRRGYAALKQGDLRTAGVLADLLANRGYVPASHLLRGKIWLTRSNRDLRSPPAVAPYEDAEQAAQLVSAAADLASVPLLVREMSWLSSTLVQEPFTHEELPARQHLRKALAEFVRVYDDGPLGVEATLLAATCLIQLDHRPTAVAGLEVLSKQHPKAKEPHRLLAAVYMDLNVPSNAVEHLSAWSDLDPSDGKPLRWIGLFRRQLGLTEQAVGAYEQALARHLDPSTRADTIRELAEVYIGTEGDYRKALDLFDQCPAELQDTPELLTLRTQCLISLGRSTEAAQLLDALLAKRPNYPPALVLRGKMYVTEEQPAKALPFLDKAVRLNPYSEKAHQQLAEALGLLHQDKRALQEAEAGQHVLQVMADIGKLRNAAVAKPWADDVRVRLGLLCLKIDRRLDALAWFRAALACNPHNRLARQWLDSLGTGGQRGEGPSSSATR